MEGKKKNLTVNIGPLGPSPGHCDLGLLLPWLLLIWYWSVLPLSFPRAWDETLGGNLVLEVWRGKLAVLQLLAEPSVLSSSSEMMQLLLWAAFAEYLDYVIFPVCHMWGILWHATQPTLVSLHNVIGTHICFHFSVWAILMPFWQESHVCATIEPFTFPTSLFIWYSQKLEEKNKTHKCTHTHMQQKQMKETYRLGRTLVHHVSLAIIVCVVLSVVLQLSIETYWCLVIIINNGPGTICKWTSGWKAYVWVGELIFITVGIFGKMIRNQQTLVITVANLLYELKGSDFTSLGLSCPIYKIMIVKNFW